jgi:hypothetical protein
MVVSLRSFRITALLVPLVLLPACRQDAILKESANFKDSATGMASAQAQLAPAVDASCRRRKALLSLGSPFRTSNDVKKHANAVLGRGAKDCKDELGDLIVAHTKVVVAYAALLQRAATSKDISLQAGTLFESAQKSVVLKSALKPVPAFVTKDAVDSAVNGIVTALANRSRADAIAGAVRSADHLIQSFATEFEYYFGHDDICSADASIQMNHPMQWCAVFDPEYEQVVSTYGSLITNRFPNTVDEGKFNPTALRAEFSAALERAGRTGDYQPAATLYTTVLTQIRARSPQGADFLRPLVTYAQLERGGQIAARQRDAARLRSLFGAAMRTLDNTVRRQASALDDPLRTRLDADLKSVSGAIAVGTSFASAMHDFAATHGRVATLLNDRVPDSTAVFDR